MRGFVRLWKPAGVLSSTRPSEHGPHIAVRAPLVPVGRLDKASSGLLLLCPLQHEVGPRGIPPRKR